MNWVPDKYIQYYCNRHHIYYCVLFYYIMLGRTVPIIDHETAHEIIDSEHRHSNGNTLSHMALEIETGGIDYNTPAALQYNHNDIELHRHKSDSSDKSILSDELSTNHKSIHTNENTTHNIIAPSTPSKKDVIARNNYIDYIRQLKSTWSDCPVIDITFESLSYKLTLPTETGDKRDIPNLYKKLKSTVYDNIKHIFDKQSTYTLYALNNITGTLQHGTMTLILSNPGGGKSCLLKSLAGQFNYHNDKRISGSIKYNGYDYTQSQHINNLRVNRLCSYMNQTDNHLATLTVKETLQFANDNANADITLLDNVSDELIELDKHKTELMISLLDMSSCENTIAGNDLLRGISGGQKKRLTVGEMLITNSRIYLCDEITNGLDAQVATEINTALREWCDITQGIVVSALLQPTPETYNLFDQILLLIDGNILYQGPRTQVMPYLRSLGAVFASDVDDADNITAFLANPDKFMSINKLQHSHQQLSNSTSNAQFNINNNKSSNVSRSNSPTTDKSSDESIDTAKLNATVQTLITAYESSTQYQQHKQYINDVNNKQLSSTPIQHSAFTAAQYSTKHTRYLIAHFYLLLYRQFLIVGRNVFMYLPRFFISAFMGFVFGTLYIGLGGYNTAGETNATIANDNLYAAANRMGLVLFAVTNGAFNNFIELPDGDEKKPVVYKQMDAGHYPGWVWTLSAIVVSIPILITETLILTTIVYWATSFADDVGRYFFMLLCVFVSDLLMMMVFRMISYLSPNQFVAQQLGGPCVGLFMVFGGFLITRGHIPIWLIEFYYISPFSYILKSIAQSEFTASRYNFVNAGQSVTAGTQYLLSYEMQTQSVWKWIGVLYVFSCFIIFAGLATYAVTYRRASVNLGTKRKRETDDDELIYNNDNTLTISRDNNTPSNRTPPSGNSRNNNALPNDVAISIVPVQRQTSDIQSSLPFTPVSVSWNHIGYTVKVKKENKVLLTDVSGFCKPGELTALMGSSGAGKTTLIDVIAGRKTAGVQTGDILVGGQIKNQKTFSKLAGYAEQQDLHMPFATVRESLQFAAALRLPASVTVEQRNIFVAEMMELLELNELADRIIGDESAPVLSPAQKKLVTIGVEMVCNPSILFLDEPTTSLDSRAALNVMRVVKKIVKTGRTVLCTIHQPSSEVFYLFDRLLLLRTGGTCVYYGECGKKGLNIVNYFMSTPDCPPIQPDENPASWMLNVLSNDIDYTSIWQSSQQKLIADQDTAAASQLVDTESNINQSHYQRNYIYQFQLVLARANRSWFRNLAFNWVRLMSNLTLGTVYGLVYLQVNSNNFAGVRSKLAGIFLAVSFGGVVNAFNAMPSIAVERAVFYREKSSQTYAALVYALTLFVVEIPYLVMGGFLFCIPFYFLMGLDNIASHFFQFWFVFVINAMIFNSLGHAGVAILPNILAATQMLGLFFTLLMLFGGVFASASTIPTGWYWLYFINSVPKSMAAMAMPQFLCTNPPNGANCGTLAGLGSNVTTESYVASFLSIDEPNNSFAEVQWLVLILAVVRTVAILAIQFVSHIKR